LAESYGLISQKVTGNAIVKYDTNTDVMTNYKDTSAGLFNFDIGSTAATGFFAFDCNDSWVRNVEFVRGGGDAVQKLNISFDFLIDHANTQYVVFQTADALDEAW
jgi:hypothetical protein